ncbi:MAG: cyclic nucleotide-binding domain-containing protein [Planctomycetes bacterium]|nr:cyclic nucleotide-binding domain-containing protein [Planctomycetota bacterium]
MKKRTEFLGGIDIFQEMTDEELKKLDAIIQEEVFRKGDTIFREKEAGVKLYIVYSGTVEIGKLAEGDKRHTRIDRLEKGEIFGELAVFTEMPRSAAAVAAIAAETRLLSLDRARLERLMSDDLALANKILRGVLRKVAQRLRTANEAIRTLVRNMNLGWY